MENSEFSLEKKEIKPIDGKSLISLKLMGKKGESEGSGPPSHTKPEEIHMKPSKVDMKAEQIHMKSNGLKKPVIFTMEPLSLSPTEPSQPREATLITPPGQGTRTRRLSHSDRSWSTSRIQITNPRKQSLQNTFISPAQSPAQSFCNSFNRQATFSSFQDCREEYGVGDTISDYKLVKVLGSGASSQVFLATTTVKPSYLPDSINLPEYKVAVKIVKGDGGNEVSIWKDLSHPSILEMIETISIDNLTIIVSELAEGGSLLDLVRKSVTGLDKPLIKKIMVDIMKGVSYLHSEGIIHHDIKLENILLTSTGAKICDFGLSSFIKPPLTTIHASLSRQKGMTTAVGSLHYIPPELLIPNSHIPTTSVDIWACGCVLYGMVTGILPFNDTFLPRLQMMIVSGKYEDVSDLSWSTILKGMLCPVEQRWDASRVLYEIENLVI